ncbi:MAG: CPBP family intramembrane metalloprotease [Microthrixaceae bacterium]|nr:CPBP family intramembrane metalloprotease [Microthrixaceae bacterium]
MSRRLDRDVSASSTDAVTRLLLLAGLWLGSRLVAAVVAAPFIDVDEPLSSGTLVVSQLPFWAATVGGLWWMARREGEAPARFVRWGFAPADLAVGAVAGFGLHWGVNLLYRALEDFGVSGDPSASARSLVDASPGFAGKATLLVMVAVGAPIVEELYYRGVAQRTVVELAGGDEADGFSMGAVLGVGAVAAFFALSHVSTGDDLIQLPGLTLVGVILGVLVWRTGRLGPAIVAHGVFNLCSLLVLWGVSSPLLAG